MTDPDQAAFVAECEAHRARLRLHCYRMLGGVDEADDMVQETFLRAWRSRASFEGRAQLSTWLHRIATNVCLDVLATKARRVLPQDVVRAVQPTDQPRATPPLAPELPWLEPFPDRLLDPESLTASRESIELAFLAALQHLPAKQRATLLLCDVLGWSAKETADLLELTVPAVTSALQRAHATMKELAPAGRTDWAPLAAPTDAERALLARYMQAWEQGDANAITQLLRDDVRWAMPPASLWFDGIAAVRALLTNYPPTFHGHHKLVPIGANRQLAAAGYMRRHGASDFVFSGIQVLRTEANQIAEITSFGAPLCRRFELPMIFSAPPV